MADKTLSLLVKLALLEKVSAPLRAIRGGSKSTTEALATTRREVGALQRSQARIAAFKGLEARMKADADALAKARFRMVALKSEIVSTDGPTKRLTQSFNRAEGQVRKLEQRMETQGRELQDMSGKLEAAGIDVADLARHEDRLAGKIHEANGRLKEQQTRLDQIDAARARVDKAEALGSKLRSGGTSSIVAGVAIGAPIAAATKQTADFQSRMTDIAQKANISRAAAAAMGREFDRMGPKVGQIPDKLAEGVDALAGFGLDPRRAVKMIEPIGKAATAYNAEVLDLAGATFSTVDNLKVPIAQTSKTLDVMAAAGKAGAFEVKDMAQFFPALTASAQALGQKGVPAVADLAAALQITRKGAGDSAQAANNLQNLLNKVNTEDTIKNFKEFGIDLPKAMKAAAAAGKSPIEAIAELAKQATKGDLSKLSFLFGDAQVQAALRPLIQNIGLYRQIRADALAANGTVETDFAERMVDANAKMSRLGAVAQSVGHRIGNALLPTVSAVADKLSVLGEKVSAWADRNPELAATLAKVAAGIAILLILGGALAIAIGTILGPFAYLRFMMLLAGPGFLTVARFMLAPLRVIPLLVRALWFLAGGIAKAGLFLLANPVILAIMLIVGAIALAGYMIWKHWDTIKAAFWAGLARLTAFWGTIKGLFNAGLAWFAGLSPRFMAFGANLIQGLINGVTGKIAALKAKILGLAENVKGWFKNALGIHSPSRVFAGLGGFVTEGLAQGIDKGGAAPVQRIQNIATRMAAAMTMGAAAPALAAGGAGGVSSPPSARAPIVIQATFHIQASAADAPAVEAAVKRALDEARRAADAAQRSSYADDDD